MTSICDKAKLHGEQPHPKAEVPTSHCDSGYYGLMHFPPEILLHIFSYLDLPDLDLIAQVIPELALLTNDPVLHRYRLLSVSPARVSHNLFGKGPQGHPLRPTVPELVQRGVLRLGIERQWRIGAYFYSKSAIVQYENGRALLRRIASNVVSVQLRRRTMPESAIKSMSTRCVYPDVSPNVARSLLPIVRQLKWSLQRDRLAKVFKDSGVRLGMSAWVANGEYARRIFPEDEKFRLAVCPDSRKARAFFEKLSKI